jgi:hypothetical protein
MKRTLLITGLVIVIGGVVVWLRLAPTSDNPTVPEVARAASPAPMPASLPNTSPRSGVKTAEAPAAAASVPALEAPVPPKSAVSGATGSSAVVAKQSAGNPTKEIADPLARAALSFVGADPEAEAYWYGAINDPKLSANERKDLIEDLNEDGLSDPRRPGPEDLPLILSRLALIEEAAPYAMDEVNADAFQEAYKDLVNLAARLAQR